MFNWVLNKRRKIQFLPTLNVDMIDNEDSLNISQHTKVNSRFPRWPEEPASRLCPKSPVHRRHKTAKVTKVDKADERDPHNKAACKKGTS